MKMSLSYRKGIFGNGLIADDSCLYYHIDQLDQVKLCRRKCMGTYCWEHKKFSVMNRRDALKEIQSYDHARRHQVDVDMGLQQNLASAEHLLTEYRKLTMLNLNGEISPMQYKLFTRMSTWISEMSEIDIAMEMNNGYDDAETSSNDSFIDDNIIYEEPPRPAKYSRLRKNSSEEYVDEVMLYD